MHAPAVTATATVERAMQTRRRAARTGALPAGGFLRLDWLDNLALLKRHGRLLHNRFVAAQSVLNVDRRAEVPAEHHRLEVQPVARPDDCDPSTLCVE